MIKYIGKTTTRKGSIIMATKKQFKTESKKMLDMMINSIYTHKEIFLRELISNASDAIDKRRFRSLTDGSADMSQDYAIELSFDKDARTITIVDNGCGMTLEELEKNLGTIAKSGSGEFKKENADAEDIDVIGQFGVGFYSAFMVSDKITVESLALGADTANVWQSEGVDGYTVDTCGYDRVGTRITMHIKEDTENEKYGEFLSEYKLRELVRKYSDYIRYPIKMEVEHQKLVEGTGVDGKDPEYESVKEIETLNSMVPLWHKSPDEVTKEEYESFYTEKFYDYRGLASTVHFRTEGTVSYEALLFIPKKAPFNYYTKNFEKGLSLYSSGVMITECCSDLLPDHFSFVKGIVDSADISLNISREVLQHDHQLRAIAKNIEKKLRSELSKMQKNDREAYEAFWREFGMQIKFGIYNEYGKNKDNLKDLIMFTSSKEEKLVTLKEYVDAMPEAQKKIYYACGESIQLCKSLPRTAAVTSKGFEVLYFTDEVDEFAIKTLEKYAEKEFVNVCDEDLDISTDEEKKALESENENAKDLLECIKEALDNKVVAVKFSDTLGDHPVSLSSEGGISTEMEKVLGRMPGSEEMGGAPKAQTVLQINVNHSVKEALLSAFANDREKLKTYSKVLYAQARLVCGLSVEDPAELSSLVCSLM